MSERTVTFPRTAYVSMTNFSSDAGTTYEMTVTDPTSGAVICEVRIPALALVAMLASKGEQSATLTHANSDIIGLHKHMDTVFIPDTGYDSRKTFDFSPYETDGWKCSRSDYGNGHRVATQDGVRGFRVGRARLMPEPQEGRAVSDYDPRVHVLAEAVATAAAVVKAMQGGPSASDARFYVDEFTKATQGVAP